MGWKKVDNVIQEDVIQDIYVKVFVFCLSRGQLLCNEIIISMYGGSFSLGMLTDC